MDREKVINGLAELKETIRTAKPTSFVSGGFCAMNMKRLDNAIELLKDQEPVEPELEGGGYNWWHVCGECHGAIDASDNYCKHCGRRIKHEKKE